MIDSTCPRCGMLHRAPAAITEFACCAHTSARHDRSLLQAINITGPEYKPARNRDKPGDEVYLLIKRHFGVDPAPGCQCRKVQRRMNALGWEKCLAVVDQLEASLESNAKEFGWGVTIAAATRAVVTGALAWLHPLQPWRSLIVEGCRRARESSESD